MLEDTLNSIPKLISVIVPVYNVESYIRRCIDSIINQSYNNLEIILVDDGSTDNSGKICDEYKAKDSRVVVIHKKNEGLSSARNEGLNIAKGELIGFVDADDFIEYNMYEELKNNMDKYDSDISICNYFYIKNDKRKIFISKIENDFCESNKDKFYYINNEYCALTVHAWNKLYKMKVFDNLRYPYGRIYEDSYILCNILENADRVSYTLKPLYNYVYRKNSIVNTFNINHFDKIDSFNRKIDFLNNKGYYDVALKEKNIKAKILKVNLSKMVYYRINNKEVWDKYYKELLNTSKEIKWKDSNKYVKRFKVLKKDYIYFSAFEFKVRDNIKKIIYK